MNIRDLFKEARDSTESELAAAILVLADVIENKTFFDKRSAENLGHELCMSLNETVLSSIVTISGDIDIKNKQQ
jgi:hypothetical protein